MQLNPSEISELLKSRIQNLGVSTELRRSHEDEFVEYYRARLADHGVTDYSAAQAREAAGSAADEFSDTATLGELLERQPGEPLERGAVCNRGRNARSRRRQARRELAGR